MRGQPRRFISLFSDSRPAEMLPRPEGCPARGRRAAGGAAHRARCAGARGPPWLGSIRSAALVEQAEGAVQVSQPPSSRGAGARPRLRRRAQFLVPGRRLNWQDPSRDGRAAAGGKGGWEWAAEALRVVKNHVSVTAIVAAAEQSQSRLPAL